MDKLLRDLPAPLRYGSAGMGALLVVLLAVFAVASGGGGPSNETTVTPTEAAGEERQALAQRTSTPSPTPASPTRTPTPEPTPSPTPEPTVEPTPEPPPPFDPTAAYVVTTATTYSEPTALSQPIQQLYEGTQVALVGAVTGQNWIIGDQDWVPVEQPWERTWYLLEDGSYIYRAFVYFPDGASPFGPFADPYVLVDVNAQYAYAMDGEQVVREIPITSGKAGFETPIGHFEVQARVQNERMTSERAGITGEAEQYDVHRVLFTQYFAAGGFALHLNYWQPEGVYGSYPTSHGCVGIPLADAQFLWLFSGYGTRVVVREGGGATPAPAPPPPPTAEPIVVPTEAPAVEATEATEAPTVEATAPSPTATATATPQWNGTPSEITTATP